jgi:hypothetical protein
VVVEFRSVNMLLWCLGIGWRRLGGSSYSPRGLGAVASSKWKLENIPIYRHIGPSTVIANRRSDWLLSLAGWHWTIRWCQLAIGCLVMSEVAIGEAIICILDQHCSRSGEFYNKIIEISDFSRTVGLVHYQMVRWVPDLPKFGTFELNFSNSFWMSLVAEREIGFKPFPKWFWWLNVQHKQLE